MYHWAPVKLGQGSIIEPGNWGRMLKHYGGNFGNGYVLARELLFESIRANQFAQAPSRLSSCFLLLDRDAADRYGAANAQLNVLHEVEIVDAAAPQHQGSLAALGVPQERFLLHTTNAANLYWSGRRREGDDIELVTASALRVIRAVE